MNTKAKIIAGLVFLGGLSAFFYFKGKNSGNTNSENSVDDAEKAIIKKDLSQPETWYSSTADGFETYLPDCGASKHSPLIPAFMMPQSALETGSTAIKYIVGHIGILKTKSDWLKLIVAFNRRYSAWVQVSEKSNLIQWLQHFVETGTYYYLDKDGNALEKDVKGLLNSYLKNFGQTI
jgi:hypothetical protein